MKWDTIFAQTHSLISVKAHYLSCQGKQDSKPTASHDIREWIQSSRAIKKPRISKPNPPATATSSAATTSSDGSVETESTITTSPREIIEISE